MVTPYLETLSLCDINCFTPLYILAFKPVQMHGNYISKCISGFLGKKKQYIYFQQNKNKNNENFASLKINFCT